MTAVATGLSVGRPPKELVERLKKDAAALEQEGHSREEMSRRLGVSPSTLRKWLGRAPRFAQYAAPPPEKLKAAQAMIAAGTPYARISRSLGIHEETLRNHFGPSPIDSGVQFAREERSRIARERYDEMVRLRMKEGLRNEQIAERTGMSYSRVYQLLGPTPKRLGGVKVHPVGWRSRARYLQAVGYEPIEIAREMNLPRQTVWEWLNGRH